MRGERGNRRNRAKLRVAVAIVGVVMAVVAKPMPAPAIYTYFSFYGSYCGMNVSNGVQIWDPNPINTFFITSEVRSLAEDGAGICRFQQPILPGLMATLPVLEVWYGTYVVCNAGVHQVNQTTYYREVSSTHLSGCGAGSDYRVRGGSRITRPDGNDHNYIYQYL